MVFKKKVVKKNPLVEEKESLYLKIQKLNNFLESKDFLKLDTLDQNLLIKQQRCMLEYCDVLSYRIERL